MRYLLTAICAGALAASAALGCGADSDCVIGDRTYRVRVPSETDGSTPYGAIFFSHGYKGSAAGVMRNAGLLALADELGVALIAPKSAGDDWALPHAPNVGGTPPHDEMAYVDAVIADVTQRLPIDPDNIMASGFSAGGMMTWSMACRRADRFIGFVPIAGTFWAPVPDSCATGPANVLHFHGTRDRVVPLNGRAIADTRQGSVPQAIEMYIALGGFGPPTAQDLGGADCQMHRNASGQSLALCLYDAGHSLRLGHLRAAWHHFQAR